MHRFPLLIFILIILSSRVVSAEELELAIGLTLPPYIFPDTKTGLELDIVRESLGLVGYSIKPVPVPFARVTRHLTSGKVDGALTVSESAGLEDVFFSESHITYHNVAVSLAGNRYRIEKIDDLVQRSVLAFQNATKYLGSEYASATKRSKAYHETHDQKKQVLLLYKKRTQVIIIDINIFKYYRQQLEDEVNLEEVTIHEIFSPSPYKVGFRAAGVRDAFNKGLAELRKTGRYDEIIRSYIH